ncbi:solute symporter family protein [Pseudonocardia acaciae]|uniref:solute symporter family protein n=1 Tax=Pseudonocardia acaciae TaxID=551276 RepID=UPI00048C1CD8|nr:cation acetate symporter [Pseudonocardia acaciae]
MNPLALLVSTVVVAATLVVTYYAARRTRTTDDFWTAGRGLSGRTNGLAIAGDFLSSSSLLGYAGLAFLFGLDGFLYAAAASGIFLMVLFLVAEKMRNLGRYTFADALALRLRSRPVRAVSAVSTLCVCVFYLLAQLVAGGVLLEALAGIDFRWSVVLAAVLMLCYVLFGGMLATTWVQVIKATLVMAVVVMLVVLVLIRVGPNPLAVVHQAVGQSPAGEAFLGPGLTFRNPWNLLSMAVAVTLSSVGLPHVLMRFFTVPDAREARRSGVWAVGLIGGFNLLICFLGLAARAVLGEGGAREAGQGGNLALPALARWLGGGQHTVGGDLLLALVAAVGFATILAVTAGLVLSASSAVAHDLWTNLLRRGEHEEPGVGRVAAVVVVAISVAATLVVGAGKNVTFLATLATATAASANFPVLLLTMVWRRMTTPGAITGALTGLVSAVVLIVLGPSVWPGGEAAAPFPLAFPVLVSVPLGFLGCWLGSVLGREKPDRSAFEKVKVRALVGSDVG